MMHPIPLTIWMNMPTFYQADLFRELVRGGDVDLKVVFAKDLTGDRLALGWQQDFEGFDHIFLNPRNPVRDALRVAWSQRRRTHLVNGLWAERSFSAALALFAAMKTRYAIYSEAPEWIKSPSATTRRSVGKRIAQSVFGKLIAPNAAGVLPVSRFSTRFFKEHGVGDKLIYPFGYFRAKPAVEVAQASPRGALHKSDSAIDVVFIGRFVAYKRQSFLIEAMSPLFAQHAKLTLNMIGSGELLEALQHQVKQLNLTGRVNFEPVLHPDEVPKRIARADLLVLPSDGEGWGLVVNEALSVGVPVILSDKCGAAELIRNGVNGFIFRNGEMEDLRSCLRQFIERRDEWDKFRRHALAVGEQISTDHAAAYLVECLRHMTGETQLRPTPPWYSALGLT
jgi:glycosyltransferase involved in cell wall biosynthesis